MNDSLLSVDTAPTEISTLSLHDALPIWGAPHPRDRERDRRRAHPPRRDPAALGGRERGDPRGRACAQLAAAALGLRHGRSEEHTSERQSLAYLVCRLLLEKKNITLL